jgi:hypothetical protein
VEEEVIAKKYKKKAQGTKVKTVEQEKDEEMGKTKGFLERKILT